MLTGTREDQIWELDPFGCRLDRPFTGARYRSSGKTVTPTGTSTPLTSKNVARISFGPSLRAGSRAPAGARPARRTAAQSRNRQGHRREVRRWPPASRYTSTEFASGEAERWDRDARCRQPARCEIGPRRRPSTAREASGPQHSPVRIPQMPRSWPRTSLSRRFWRESTGRRYWCTIASNDVPRPPRWGRAATCRSGQTLIISAASGYRAALS